MANAIYPKAKESFLKGDLDLDGTVKITLIDTADYTYNSAHDNIDDVAAASRVATATLASKTFTNGAFDAADVTFSAVTGDQCEALVVWLDTGVESTSKLIAYYDTGITGMPVTPNGGDITVTFNASGLFSL